MISTKQTQFLDKSQLNSIFEEVEQTVPVNPTQETVINWDIFHNSSERSIGELPCYEYSVPTTTDAKIIDNHLRSEMTVPGVIVTAKGNIVTAIPRRRFFELTGTRYGVSVFLNRPIGIMAKSIKPPMLLNGTCKIGKAVKQALSREIDQAYEPIIVYFRQENRYKLLDVYTLLLAQSSLYEDLQNELKDNNQSLEARVRVRTNKLATVNHRLEKEIETKNKIEKNLQRKIQFEQAIAACGDTLLSSEDDPSRIATTLQILQRAIDVSRIYFGRLKEEKRNDKSLSLQIVYEHALSQIERTDKKVLTFKSPNFSSDHFWSGKSYVFQNKDRHDLTLSHNQNRSQSILLIPVGNRETHYGCIALDETRYFRNWTKEERDLLKTIANMLFSFLERIKNKLALSKARDRALHANQAKSLFLANMSHELRTPLNAIIGYSEIIIEDAQESQHTETMEKDAERILEAGRHLLSIINNILDFSKIEVNKIDISMRQFDIEELIESVLAVMKPLFDQSTNRFQLIPPKENFQMVSDPVRLKQVLFNLLSNGLKFTDNGLITLQISREFDQSGKYVVIRVSDTGIGIDPAQLPTLFQPFMQGDNSLTKEHQGTGLGLSISSELCKRLGGTIAVSSRPNEGSSFTVRLPLFPNNITDL